MDNLNKRPPPSEETRLKYESRRLRKLIAQQQKLARAQAKVFAMRDKLEDLITDVRTARQALDNGDYRPKPICTPYDG